MQNTLRTDQEGGGMGTFVLAMLCGAAVGAAVGMMFAPKPGAEMRQQLADQTERLRQRAAEQADRLRQRATEVYNGASDTINDVMARGRAAINVGREVFEKRHDGHASDMTGTP